MGTKCELEFESGSAPGDVVCVEVEIICDEIKEYNESFAFAISPGDAAAHVTLHHSDVYILDDDSMWWPCLMIKTHLC